MCLTSTTPRWLFHRLCRRWNQTYIVGHVPCPRVPVEAAAWPCRFLVPQVPSVSKESISVTSNHADEALNQEQPDLPDALCREAVPVRTVQTDDACLYCCMHLGHVLCEAHTHGCMQIEWKYACIYTYTHICTCDSACARSTQGTYMRGIPLQSQHIHRPAFPVFLGQQLVLRRSYVWAVSNREGPHGLHMSAYNLILICNMSLLATNFPATSRSCMPRWRICMSHTTIRTPGSVAARARGDQDGAA